MEDEEEPDEEGRQGVHKPQEDVRLLVHDVQGQDAHRVVFLNGTRCSVFVPRTFGNLRKNLVQWIIRVRRRLEQIVDGGWSEAEELAS